MKTKVLDENELFNTPITIETNEKEKSYDWFCYSDTEVPKMREFEVHTHMHVYGIYVHSMYSKVGRDGHPIGMVYETTEKSDAIGMLVNARGCDCDSCRGYPSDFDKVILIPCKV